MSKPSADHPSRTVSREQSLRGSFSAIMSSGLREGHDGRLESPRRRHRSRRSRRSSLNEILERGPQDCRAFLPANDTGGDRRGPGRDIKLWGDEDVRGERDEPALDKHAPRAAPAQPATTTKPTNKDRNELPLPQSPLVREHRHKGFRRDYQLGDALRSPSDAIAPYTEAQAFLAASALENYDFAFVKRSNGSFYYAILAYRSTELVHKGHGKAMVECMNFVMSGDGATKKVAQGNWTKCVRLPTKECPDDLPSRHQPPIRVISCVPQMEDDYSMISNVSESESVRIWRGMHTA